MNQPNNEVLSNEIKNIKDQITDLKADVKEIKSKLDDNSDKIFEIIMKHLKEIEDKYISKELHKSEMGKIYLIGSIALALLWPVASFIISNLNK